MCTIDEKAAVHSADHAGADAPHTHAHTHEHDLTMGNEKLAEALRILKGEE